MRALQGVKCSVIDCARDAVKRYVGRDRPGRLPEGAACGVPYCAAHYHQVHRTKAPPTPGPLRKRGIGQYAKGVEAAAELCEFHGHPDLAALVRGLK